MDNGRRMTMETTLAEVRALVREHLQPGMPAIDCPACGQRVKRYKYKLDSGMARALVKLGVYDDFYPGQMMDYRNRFAGGEARKHSLLRHWGLIERADHRTGKRAGFWRITPAGHEFLGGSEVPWAIWHFNDHCLGFTQEQTTIRRALGDKFNLEELLASAREEEEKWRATKGS